MQTGTKEWLSDDVAFPIHHCDNCGGDVLVYARLVLGPSGGELVWRCLFCDEKLQNADGAVEYRSLFDLIASAIEKESPDMDDGWVPLGVPGGHWGSDESGT